MTDKRHLELFLLRYVPSPIANDSVNIGFVLLELSESARTVIEARFTANWQPVRALDPDADINLLYALALDICERVKNGNPEDLLQRMDDSFSNAIQLSPCIKAEEDIETLVAKFQ